MAAQEDGESPSVLDYWQDLMVAAFVETKTKFGINAWAVFIGVLTLIGGGTYAIVPKVLADNQQRPLAAVVIVLGVFVVILLLGSYARHRNDHKTFRELIAPLKAELAALKAEQQRSQQQVATVEDVRRVMLHLEHRGWNLEGAEFDEWHRSALEFVQLSCTPSRRVDFETPDMPLNNYPGWFSEHAKHIKASDLNPGITVASLRKWQPT